MLRKWWRYIVGTPNPSPIELLVKAFVENQEKSQQLIFNAVTVIGEASSKQAEVLQAYLKLFSGTGEPQRWERDMVQENVDDLTARGFPTNGTEITQAEWVLAHINEL